MPVLCTCRTEEVSRCQDRDRACSRVPLELWRCGDSDPAACSKNVQHPQLAMSCKHISVTAGAKVGPYKPGVGVLCCGDGKLNLPRRNTPPSQLRHFHAQNLNRTKLESQPDFRTQTSSPNFEGPTHRRSAFVMRRCVSHEYSTSRRTSTIRYKDVHTQHEHADEHTTHTAVLSL